MTANGTTAAEARPNAYYCYKSGVVEKDGDSQQQQTDTQQQDLFSRSGLVNGSYVSDLVIDTGCNQSIVHASLVPKDRYVEGRSVRVRCVHGDIVTYPLADIDFLINDCPIEMRVAVSETLPESALLGKDVPDISLLLQPVEDAFSVTRAQQRQQEAETRLKMGNELINSATSESVMGDNDDNTDTGQESPVSAIDVRDPCRSCLECQRLSNHGADAYVEIDSEISDLFDNG